MTYCAACKKCVSSRLRSIGRVSSCLCVKVNTRIVLPCHALLAEDERNGDRIERSSRRRAKLREIEWRGPEKVYSSTVSLTSALGEGVRLRPRPGRFTSGKETRYPLYRRLGGPQGQSVRVQEISLPPGFFPRTVQTVASRYTGYDIIPDHKFTTFIIRLIDKLRVTCQVVGFTAFYVTRTFRVIQFSAYRLSLKHHAIW
jgi:hypothetical protein